MIAQKIANLRKLKKITEKEISENIGMSMTGFRQAMANDDFKVSTLQKIADYLKVDIIWFFTKDSDQDSSDYVLNDPKESYKTEVLIQKDLLLKQKDELIQDLKYTIEGLKHALETSNKFADYLQKDSGKNKK